MSLTPATRCRATSRSGDQCKRYASPGATVCTMHGGKAPQVRQRAAERVLETRLSGELERRGIEPVTNPVIAVQELAGESLAWLEVCREHLARLSTLDYADARGVEDVKPAIALYERALASAQRVAADMVRLGIEAKAASQVHEQAAEIIELVRDAVRIARAEPEESADAILLRLIGGDQ